MARIQPEHAQEHWQQNDLHQIAVDVAESSVIIVRGNPVMLGNL